MTDPVSKSVSTPPTIEIRPAAADDADAFPGFDPAASLVALLAIEGETIIAAASIAPGACPVEPETPGVTLFGVSDAPDVAIDQLLAALVDAARTTGVARLLIGWDPMDAPGLRRLEGHGFRPAGRGPYFPLGGNEVQYVSGYQDATGSTLDLVLIAQ